VPFDANRNGGKISHVGGKIGRKKDSRVISLKQRGKNRHAGSYWILPILLVVRECSAAVAGVMGRMRSVGKPRDPLVGPLKHLVILPARDLSGDVRRWACE
jgi:hypothetical protein